MMRTLLTCSLALAGLILAPVTHSAQSGDKDVLPLEGITVSAEKRREMMARILRIGMSNVRSDKAEDAHKIVCEIRKQTGTHIADLECGSNAAFNYRRAVNFTMNSAVISQIAISQAYTTSGGDVHGAPMNTGFANAFGKTTSVADGSTIMTFRGVSRGAVKKLINDYATDVNPEENRQRLVRDMIWTNFTAAEGRYGFSADQYTAFVQAYKVVKSLDNAAYSSESMRENAMESAIRGFNLSVDEYNAMFDKVMTDDDLRARVVIALQIEI